MEEGGGGHHAKHNAKWPAQENRNMEQPCMELVRTLEKKKMETNETFFLFLFVSLISGPRWKGWGRRVGEVV